MASLVNNAKLDALQSPKMGNKIERTRAALNPETSKVNESQLKLQAAEQAGDNVETELAASQKIPTRSKELERMIEQLRFSDGQCAYFCDPYSGPFPPLNIAQLHSEPLEIIDPFVMAMENHRRYLSGLVSLEFGLIDKCVRWGRDYNRGRRACTNEKYTPK